MKFHILVASLLFAPLLMAGFKVPSTVFELSELDEAKAKAVERKKPLSFLWSNSESSCGLCNAASEEMIDEFKSRTVMVYVSTKEKLPDSLKGAFKRGKYIPKLAVYDVTMAEKLGDVIYEDLKKKGEKKAFEQINKTIRDYRKTL